MKFVQKPDPAARRTPPARVVGAPSGREPLFGAISKRLGSLALRIKRRAGDGSGRGFLCVLGVIAAASAAIGMRAPAVRAAPALAAVYEAVGLPVNLVGLELRDVRARIVRDGSRRVLVTEGEIVNIRREENDVPPLALAVRGADGVQRYGWTTPAPKARLEAGEVVTFRARLAAPPKEGIDVVVRFASDEAPAADPLDFGDLRLTTETDSVSRRTPPPADIPNPAKMP